MEKANRNELVELTHPLIRHLLRSCRFARAGAPITAKSLKGELRRIMEQIRTDCENKPALKRDFERIERPLVFFIDYTIKEGGLPFSADWVELARDYNELSGDEKFFDMLSDTLEDPDAKSRLYLFYLMLGYGFDGCHCGEGDFLERKMRLCATRFPTLNPVSAKELFESAGEGGVRMPHPRRMLAFVTFVAVVFAALSLAFNIMRFGSATADYRAALDGCLEAAGEVLTK